MDAVRRQTIERFNCCFPNGSSYFVCMWPIKSSHNAKLTWIRSLEHAIAAKHYHEVAGYIESCYRIVACNNLQCQNSVNEELEKVFANHIKLPAQTDTMEIEEDAEKVSPLYSCRKCNSRCLWTQQQTRSADEPMTVFLRCTNPLCKYEWRL